MTSRRPYTISPDSRLGFFFFFLFLFFYLFHFFANHCYCLPISTQSTMVSLWNKKKDGGERESQQDHEDNQSRYHQEADERTRLLPRDNPAYLSPDDPAVSN